jgi:hypothetical protein
MGLFDSTDSLFGSDLLGSSVSDLFSGFSDLGGSYGGISTGTPVSYSTYQPSYQLQPEYPIQAQPVMSIPQTAITAAGAMARWAFKFPNLWQAIQKLAANFRARVTPEMLWSMARKFGSGVIISMIGAAAFNELVIYKTTHKRRRMDVANTKALRRSLRRLKGFHRLSSRVEMQLARRGGRRRSMARCVTCRKSPCAC